MPPPQPLEASLARLCRLTDLAKDLLTTGHLLLAANRRPTHPALAICRAADTMLTDKQCNEQNGRTGAAPEAKPQLKCFWPKCLFKTLDPKQLRDHYSVHQKTKNQFKCDANNCQKTFKYKQNLIQHKLIQHKFSVHSQNRKQLFVCEVADCRKSFGQKLQLIRHKSIHRPQAGHQSNQTAPDQNQTKPGLIFAHKSNVLVNSSKMSNENQAKKPAHRSVSAKKPKDKRFICDYNGCDKCFDSKSNLERHKRIHSGEKPFGCDIAGCGQRFTQKTHLVQHKKRKHRIILPKGAIKLIKPLDSYEKPSDVSNSVAPEIVFTPTVVSTPKPALNSGRHVAISRTPTATNNNNNNNNNHNLSTQAVDTPVKSCADMSCERQYKCYIERCQHSYDSLYELKTHVNSVHPNDSLNKCLHSNCNQVFKSFYNLYYHKKTFHL